MKVTDKMTMVYNDATFGGIKWSPDGTKITFVAEIPEIASYKPFFKDPEEKKEDKKEDKKDDDKQDDDKKKEEEEKKKAEEKKKKDEEHW